MSSEPPAKETKKGQPTLFSFFAANTLATDKANPSTSSAAATPSTTVLELTEETDALVDERETRQSASSNDIGHAVSRKLTSEVRAFFREPWVPKAKKDFPCSTHTKSGVSRQRRLLPHHLQDFPWLAVSKVTGKEDAFCVPCVLLGGRSCGHSQSARTFVTQPLTRFDDLTGKNGALSIHQRNEYYKTSVLLMEEY